MKTEHFKSRHSGAGRNPVEKDIPRESADNKVVSATRAVAFCWIPACAGMTTGMEVFK
jgi:hypothetical protein